MEKDFNKPNTEITDYSSEEETETESIITEHVDMNDLYSKDNEYLLVGIYGHGSGYLKVALNDDFKADSKTYKVKFLTSNIKDKTKPKKIIAELHQIKCGSSYNLVLFTKIDMGSQNHKYIFEYLTTKVTFKHAAVFDAYHLSKTFIPEGTKDTLYSLKNRKQIMSNQLIRAPNLPAPNSVQDFSAYLLTCFEFIDLPCVVYIAVTSLHEVCLDTIRLYDCVGVTYEFLRDKLTDDRVKRLNVTVMLKEYNSFKNSFYT
jgi:hypothetical protein